MVVAVVAGVGVAMGAAAWLAMRLTIGGRREAGLALVGAAALVCFPLALLLGSPAALGAPALGTLLGLLLASGGGSEDVAEDEPPWWPSFEDELRRYERARRPPVRPRRG
jgi:hypothetical protein